MHVAHHTPRQPTPRLKDGTTACQHNRTRRGQDAPCFTFDISLRLYYQGNLPHEECLEASRDHQQLVCRDKTGLELSMEMNINGNEGEPGALELVACVCHQTIDTAHAFLQRMQALAQAAVVSSCPQARSPSADRRPRARCSSLGPTAEASPCHCLSLQLVHDSDAAVPGQIKSQ